jgi:DNA polymerase
MTETVVLKPGADVEGFRTALRRLAAAHVPPGEVCWSSAAQLFPVAESELAQPLLLPRRVAELISQVICHSDPERYALLYELVWRLRHGEQKLLEIHSDPLVHRLHRLEKSVRRDLHKMHAFVRFQRVREDKNERYVAWFEPAHFIVDATGDFFVKRFHALHWSILTPKGSLHWNRAQLSTGPAATRDMAVTGDDYEDLWRGYYEATFNPARLNPISMRSHMAKRYWRNLPEAQSIPSLIRSAPLRVSRMIEQEMHMARKRDPIKALAAMQEQGPRSLAALNRLIQEAAPMVKGGTRAVLGEGPLNPDIALVGEQPGDQEDLVGRPFAGPAGKLLDRALDAAGIDRSKTYVTNAVKHFKFEQRGKRRLHAKPNAGEVKHYRWWLEKELDLVKPRLVVALGATATMALAGHAIPIQKNRGPADFEGRPGFITVHPSALLRMHDDDERHQAFVDFVGDLRAARNLAHRYK